MKIRCFIALPLPSEIQRGISQVQEKLRASEATVRWEPSGKFHITMKFLGDKEESQLSSLTSSLSASVQEIQSFALSFRHVGGFPTHDKPRIVWIGTDIPPVLATLHRHIEEVCLACGVEKDDRAFHPHATMGRVKGGHNIHRLTEILKSITFEPLQFRCTEIRIMRSELFPAGSHYTLMNAIPLQP
ncbi:MAG: RNA 2',3'-cyclic phosphodiesterase [Bacteroidota bacterium]